MKKEPVGRIAIIGFGREGESLYRFLKKDPEFKDKEIWILDKNIKTRTPKGVKKSLGKDHLKNLEKFEVVFRSPGIPYTLPEFVKARKKGVKFSSVIKIFLKRAEKKTEKIIGITGSKGKTTTSTLLYEILKTAKYKVFFAGNVGRSPLEFLDKLDKNSWVILELSSFQLHDLDISPRIAVLLDVFPEHQDAHGSLTEYYNAKANIGLHQSKDDLIFYFSTNKDTERIAKRSRARKIGVSLKKFPLFKTEELKIKGGHSLKNAVMASLVAKSAGVSKDLIKKVVSGFPGVPHRLQFVKKIKNISFYNDSASTNPQTSAAAISSFGKSDIVLMLGGADKRLSYAPLAKALKTSKVKALVIFGENRKKIETALRPLKIKKIVLGTDLRKIVDAAYREAKEINSKDVSVIFSPGATSFDMFKNYAERGEKFMAVVKKLK